MMIHLNVAALIQGHLYCNQFMNQRRKHNLKTFETKRKKVSGGWGKLYDAELHDFGIYKNSS
jgi:hypothetical protein